MGLMCCRRASILAVISLLATVVRSFPSTHRIGVRTITTKNQQGRSTTNLQSSNYPSSSMPSSLSLSASTIDTPIARIDENTQVAIEKDTATLGAWIPIASVSGLSGLGPTKVRVMAMDLVVWNTLDGRAQDSNRPRFTFRKRGRNKQPSPDDAGQWSVLSDACPHRMAPLHLGRIVPETGCIECPYHGWQFESNGTISHIPQAERHYPVVDDKQQMTKNVTVLSPMMRQRASTTSYDVHVTGDLLWAFLPTSIHGESFPKSMLPEDYYPGLKEDMEAEPNVYVQEMPASLNFLLENFLDPAHISFAHHAVAADRSDATPVPINVVVNNFTSLEVQTSYVRRGEYRERIYGFQRPSMMMLKEKNLQTGLWKVGQRIPIVPIEDGKSRLFTYVAGAKVGHRKMPIWKKHVVSRRLFSGDMMIHEAERTVRQQQEQQKQATNFDYVLPTSSDKIVTAYRKWWNTNGFSKAPPNTFGPAKLENLKYIPRDVQTHPWSIHTKTCSHCRKALKRARFIGYWGLVVGLLGSSISIGLGVSSKQLLGKSVGFMASAAFALAGIGSNLTAKKMVKELEGPSHPSDVFDHNIPPGDKF